MLKLSAILLLVVVACTTADLLQHDKAVLNVANFASKAISKDFSTFHYRLVKIAKVKIERVEAGNLYKLDIILGMTNCKKQDMSYEEASECNIQDNVSAYKKCSILVREEDRNGDYRLAVTGCMLISKKDL